MDYEGDILTVLRSIDGSLKQLVTQTRAAQPKPVATDQDLDGQWGNPIAKFMPRDWTGESFKGRPFSECPAPLLDLLAETFDYFGRQAEAKGELTSGGKPVAPYKYADAARARGWAKRIRDGKVKPSGNGQQDHSQWATADADDSF